MEDRSNERLYRFWQSWNTSLALEKSLLSIDSMNFSGLYPQCGFER